MKAEHKDVESDLLVDVFFSDIIRGRDGAVPEIGVNGNWWIDGKDTGVLAKGTDGRDGADGKSPYIGSNNNWWLDGRDLGVKAKAPLVSIGSNGHWLIDGVDTAVPSNIDSYLSKTTASAQSVAGAVAFNGTTTMLGATNVKGALNIEKYTMFASNPNNNEKDEKGYEVLEVSESAPHYICVQPRNDGGRVKLNLHKTPVLGDVYVVFAATQAGCTIVSSSTSVKFWWGIHDAQSSYDTQQRAIIILNGFVVGSEHRWYVFTIGD